MTDVEDHYRNLLAPVYAWTVGGAEQAIAAGAADIASLRTRSGLALDLGAGFGTHSIPLAKAGFEVLAIDSSEALLRQIGDPAGTSGIRTIVGDLLKFREHLPQGRRADLILCMGDTLTHLADRASVSVLLKLVAQSLKPGGEFVATFRDLTTLPSGVGRFIPVRSDADRILTCYLEDHDETVAVHDILHRRSEGGWTMAVGCYHKLKLGADFVRRELEQCGLRTSAGIGPRGMIKVTADA